MAETLRRYLVYAAAVIAGVSASAHRPRTAQPDTTASLRFAVIGDSGTGEKAQYEVAAVMAPTRSRLPFELVVMLGDRSQPIWLEQHLQASRALWKVAFFRHPLYSSAERHGSEKDLRRVLESLLIQYGVQVVLSGHDHVYEPITPQHGITYFVCGSSGQLRRGNLERGSGLTAAGFDRDRTFMVLEAAADTLHFQAISRINTVVDSGHIPWTVRVPRSKGSLEGGDHHEAR
jgi:hypothetical protein